MSIGKTFLLALMVTALALPLRAQASFPAQPGRDCSQLVVNRSYSQTFQGFLNVPAYFESLGLPSPPGVGIVPNGGTGFVTFLPDGKVSARVTLAIGLVGLIPDLQPDDTSQYSLAWDTSKKPPLCAGALSLNIPGEAPFHFQLLVTQDGQQIEMIHTDAGLIVSVTGFPVRTSGCSSSSVQGIYTTDVRGWLLSPPTGPLHFPPEQLLAGYAPFAFSGGLQFNPRVSPSPADFPAAPVGAASVTGWDTASVNGTIVARTEQGWYKINRDCSGTMVLRDSLGNPDFQLELFVGKGGASLHMVNVDTVPGTTVPLYILGSTATRSQEGSYAAEERRDINQ